MADRINVRIKIESFNADDGAPYWSEGKELFNLPYPDFVMLQGLLMEVQGKLHQLGQAKAAEKARGKK